VIYTAEGDSDSSNKKVRGQREIERKVKSHRIES